MDNQLILAFWPLATILMQPFKLVERYHQSRSFYQFKNHVSLYGSTHLIMFYRVISEANTVYCSRSQYWLGTWSIFMTINKNCFHHLSRPRNQDKISNQFFLFTFYVLPVFPIFFFCFKDPFYSGIAAVFHAYTLLCAHYRFPLSLLPL